MVRFEKHNKEVLDIVGRSTINWDDDFNFLTKSIPDNKELLNMFDEHNDGKASERIVDEMEKL